MFGNILFKYFDYLSYFTVSFIIFCVNFFTFREIFNLNIYLIIFFSLLHLIGSIFFIKHYLKNALNNIF